MQQQPLKQNKMVATCVCMFMSCFRSLYQVLLNVVAITILGLRNARAIFEANTCHHAIISFTFNNFMLQSTKIFCLLSILSHCLYEN